MNNEELERMARESEVWEIKFKANSPTVLVAKPLLAQLFFEHKAMAEEREKVQVLREALADAREVLFRFPGSTATDAVSQINNALKRVDEEAAE